MGRLVRCVRLAFASEERTANPGVQILLPPPRFVFLGGGLSERLHTLHSLEGHRLKQKLASYRPTPYSAVLEFGTGVAFHV